MSSLAAFLLVAIQPTLESAVDTSAARIMRNQHAPAVGIAVLKDGNVLIEKSYGLANMANQTPPTSATLYGIGSVSKIFTAMGVLMLMEDGALSLDDPASKYVTLTTLAWNAITIRQLLSMSSGIDETGEGNLTVPQRLAIAAKKPMLYKPGTGYNYSDPNYFILTDVIAAVAPQKDYWKFIQARILLPLDMTNTFYGADQSTAGFCMGYAWSIGQFQTVPSVQADVRTGSGAIVTCLNDFVKLEGALNAGKLLKPATYTLMWKGITPIPKSPNSFALGWVDENQYGPDTVAKGGNIPGFSCMILRHMDTKVTVIVQLNLDAHGLAAFAEGIAKAVPPSGSRY